MATLVSKPKVGLLLAMYQGWSTAFPELKEQLGDYLSTFLKVSADWAQVVNPGIITKEEEAIEASQLFTAESVDAIVLPGLFSPSGMILHALPPRIPVLIWNTQISDTIPKVFADRNAAWAALKSNLTCLSVPDIASTLAQTGRPYVLVTSSIDDETAIAEIKQFLRASHAAARVRRSRVGVVGPRFMGMLDVSFDEAALIKHFGLEILDLSVLDLERSVGAVSDIEVEDLLRSVIAVTNVDNRVSREELRHSARVACGITHLANQFSLDAVALGEQEPPDFLRSQTIGIFPGIQDVRESAKPVKIATETDVRAAICLLLFEYLGRGAIMCEAWMMDFSADMILLGHDGPPDLRLMKSQEHGTLTACNPWMEGVRGKGCVIEYGPAPGDVTLIMLVPTENSFAFVVGEGRIADLPTMPLGMPNFWFIPDVGITKFYQRWVQLGAGHHFVVGPGRLSGTIRQIGELLHLQTRTIND